MAFAEGVGPFPSLFPAGGYSTPGADLTSFAHVADVLNHLALPWFVLTISFVGAYALIMRNSLIDVMNDHFVMTARAKGVREKQILWRHVVPNALLPTFTIVLLSLGFVFGGVIAIEYVFSYPGLGLLEVRAIKSKDFPLLQGLFLVLGRGDRHEPGRRHPVLVPRPESQGRLMRLRRRVHPFELGGDERLDVPLVIAQAGRHAGGLEEGAKA